MKEGDPVYIKWIDACSCDGEVTKGEAYLNPIPAETVGFLLQRTRGNITVVQNRFHRASGTIGLHESMTIPRKYIVELHPLRGMRGRK